MSLHLHPSNPSNHLNSQLPQFSTLSPSLASKTACVALSQDTITWRDAGHKFLSTMPESRSDTIESLLDKYIPPTFEFISAALLESEADSEPETKPSAVGVDSMDTSAVEPQELKLTRVHLINSCCKILQVCAVLKMIE